MSNIQGYIDDLKGEDVRKANMAGMEIRAVGGETAVQALVTLCSETNEPKVKARAINLLGLLGPAAQKPLIGIFQSEQDADLKFLGAVAIGRSGNKKIVGYLVTLLGREDVFWRSKAGISLEAIGEKAVPVLIECMGTKDEVVARECANILCRMHHSNPEKIMPALAACPRKHLAVLVAGATRSDEGLELILKYIKEGVSEEECSKALFDSGAKFQDRLMAMLDKDEVYQKQLPKTIARFGPEAMAALTGRLKGAPDVLKISIMQSLDINVYPETKEVLLKSLKNRSPEVLKAVAEACARCGDLILFDLQKVFELDEDSQSRYWALYATALIGGRGMDLIHEIMRRDDEPRKKEAATMILGSVADEGFITAYMKLLSDESLFVRENALRGLKSLGLEALDMVIQVLGNEDSDPAKEMAMKYLRYVGELAVPRLRELLLRGDETQRYFAAYALGETGDKSVITDLRSSMDAGSTWVQKYAMRSLFVLGGVDEIEDYLLSKNPERSSMALDAIVTFDEKALRIIVEAVGTLDEDESQKHLAALKRMGEKALPLLEDLGRTASEEKSRMLALKAARELSGASLGF